MIEEFRPGFGRVFTVMSAVGAAVTLVVVGRSGGVVDALLTTPWLALFLVCSWAVFWRPSVVVSDSGVRLVNVTRTIRVPWPAVEDVDTQYALRLYTAYGRFSAWAAPAPGAGSALRTSMKMRSSRPENHGSQTEDGSEPGHAPTSSAGDLPGTSSGDAAFIVRRRWERLRNSGFLDDPVLEHDRVPVEWHWRVALVVIVLAILSVTTLLV